ncbi:choice-of-anchor L domain-containing protein [Cellulomonas composti]|uniref:Uncharacterized protein n=1 Tax=Cellulomonas composti TaxID=266130 RepID=A0A511J8W6_9CELL|nr:choice-of-anchor L domain-containing protein [Cellulomonas composti]GEL94435.1 hypothetical protein CCO02nite_10930 [Cellulomonas composti]
MRLPRIVALVATTTVVLGALAAPAGADDADLPDRPSPQPSAQLGAQARGLLAAGSTAEDLAAAMDVPVAGIQYASTMGSDPEAFAIVTADDLTIPTGPTDPTDPEGPVPTLAAASFFDSDWGGFPSSGDTFLVMSTGRAADALPRNSSIGAASSVLDGLDNDQGNDLARLHLELTVPTGARCLAFDVAFLSNEFPEYVGSQYNDVFTAQIGDGALSIAPDGRTVVAPSNFARDWAGNPLSINTAFGMSRHPGSSYDGSTGKMRATTPIGLGADEVDLYLSIQDLGDSVLDSAAFIDGFYWSSDPFCLFGVQLDSDRDGLLDDWETDGYTADDGTFVDLPAMGADPAVPDVFVESDYMVTYNSLGQTIESHRPKDSAIALVVQAFYDAGVHLHVDLGPNSPLQYGDQATWGALSAAGPLVETRNLGTGSYDWSQFEEIKKGHFKAARRAVFHYNLWAHSLSTDLDTTSGMSRGIGASDFIVSLGEWGASGQTELAQAGTFMHELGHNLGLHHGGDDEAQYKPNYQSVMNYTYQTKGLVSDVRGKEEPYVDYSHWALPDLDEADLDETAGIGSSLAWVRAEWCGSRNRLMNGAIDWDCDDDTSSTSLRRDVTGDKSIDVLHGHDDWASLVFDGGLVGDAGSLAELPTFIDASDEMTLEEHQRYETPEQQTAPTVFVDGPLQLTNTVAVRGAGADVVVQGDVRCNSDAVVEGDLVASGSVTLTNRCTVLGDVVAGGAVELTAAARIGGDVTTPGTLRFQSSARIRGTATVGAFVSIDARTVAALVASGALGGVTVAPGTAPVVQRPAAVPGDPAAWTGQALTWREWLNRTAAANGAPSWSAGLSAAPGCTMAPWSSSVNGATVAVAEATVVDARAAGSGCSRVTLQQMTVALSGDLVVIADDAAFVNGLTVRSADGAPHAFTVVVPGAAGACTGGGVAVPNGLTTVGPVVTSLVAPGRIQLNGGVDLTGTVTGGCLAATGSVTIRSVS